MRPIGTVTFVLAAAWLILIVATSLFGTYEYSRDIESQWLLAEKASTIQQKSEYIDKFAEALEKSGLHGSHNAVLFTTPDNGFDENFSALKSLQKRLNEIKGLDVRSFEYQTAIQQITAQEQGQAHGMLTVFSGCWWKTHYVLLWEWIGIINITLCLTILGAGIILVLPD